MNAYTTTERREFTCSCGEVHPPPPSYKQCRCGKIWNTYGIGAGGDLRTAEATKYFAREIPVREGVILAGRKPVAGPTWRRPEPTEPIEVMNGPGWWASTTADGKWYITREDASVLAQGQANGPTGAKGMVEDRLRQVGAPGFALASRRTADGGPGDSTEELNGTVSVYGGSDRTAADFTTVGPRWHGKTPGGPQGPGVDGLKQVTRYKGMSTPQLRELQRTMMTGQGTMLDPELLRELSFREVFATKLFAAIHDLTAVGGTPEADGTKTKRTDPGMKAADDWHHRDSGGRWQRSDGHPTKVKAASR